MIKRTILSAFICAVVAGCNQVPVAEVSAQAPPQLIPQLSRADIDSLVNRHTREFIQQQPALATSLNLAKNDDANYSRALPDYSPAGMSKLQQTMSLAAAELANIDLNPLTEDDRLHVEVNQVIDRYYAGFSDFSAGYIDTWGGHLPYIVSQIAGPLIDIPKILQDQQTIATKAEAKDYLRRLEAFALMIDQVHAKVTADAENGVILPQKLFPNTLKFLVDFVSPAAGQHPLVTTLAARLANSQLTDRHEIRALLVAATRTVEQMIYPAYRRVTSLMRELEMRAPQDDGIWAQPNGEKFYRHQIKYLGDSLLAPQKIHDIGLAEVRRISAEMDGILKANGMAQGSVGQRMVELARDPRFLFNDSDAGRAELLDFLNRQIERVMARAPQLFSTMPTMGVVVKRIPEVIEAGAPGGFYTPPAIDGSRAGEFAINLRDMKEVPKFSLKTLTYHEAAPGHHFQIALNIEQQGIGLMRQNAQFNAYVEGWALYSELVALEMGMYDGDSWGNLGRLQAELYRAVRLVVDTGLHYKKWTREQAIEYFHRTTGTGLSDVTSEVERYMAWPGQALGYKIGMLKLVALREFAQTALDRQFDIKAFHDVILLKGARPLSIVEQDIKRWVISLSSQ